GSHESARRTHRSRAGRAHWRRVARTGRSPPRLHACGSASVGLDAWRGRAKTCFSWVSECESPLGPLPRPDVGSARASNRTGGLAESTRAYAARRTRVKVLDHFPMFGDMHSGALSRGPPARAMGTSPGGPAMTTMTVSLGRRFGVLHGPGDSLF